MFRHCQHHRGTPPGAQPTLSTQARQAAICGRWLCGGWRLSAAVLLLQFIMPVANAHPGGLNAEGCHNNRKTGEYHCHGGGTPRPVSGTTSRANALYEAPRQTGQQSGFASRGLPPGCFVGPRGGTYTITKSGRKNYSGC